MIQKLALACMLGASVLGAVYWDKAPWHQVTPSSDGDNTTIATQSGEVKPSSSPVTQISNRPDVSKVASPIPHSELRWGAYVGWQEGALGLFEAKVGKKVDIVADFVSWGNERDFPSHWGPSVRDKGKTLLIYWEAGDYTNEDPNDARFNYDAINAGKWDEYLTQFATDAKSYGGPVILAPFVEMNDNVSPWDGTVNNNSPAKHIAAFRHLREIFRSAPNVKFGWAVNNVSVPNQPGNQIEDYYPGDAYVDYVGVDGFNFGNPWKTFDEVFAPAMAQLAVYNKPIYIFSMASRDGSQKAAWIKEGLGSRVSTYPNVVGWIWFNEDKSDNGEYDWRIDSDPQSLAAFKSIIP